MSHTYSTIQLTDKSNIKHCVVAYYVSNIVVIKKDTWIRLWHAPIIITTTPLREVAAMLREAGIALMKVVDKDYGDRYIQPCHIISFTEFKRGTSIRLLGETAGFYTTMPYEQVVKEYEAFRQE